MTILALFADVEWNGHMNDGWWVVMIVGMALFVVLAVLGVIWLGRDLTRSSSQRAAAEADPLAVLDRRLAAGEIDPEDYRERRAMLERGDAP